MSADDPDGQRCGAHRRNTDGLPCKAYAVRGTDPPRCRVHLGRRLDAVVAERDLREGAEKALARLGEAPPVGDPLERLLELAGEQDQWLAVIRERVEDLRALTQTGNDGIEREKALVLVYERALERVTRTLVDVAKLGIEERLVQVTEDQSSRLLAVLRFALVELGQDLGDERVATALRSAIAATAPKRLTR